ncbi:TolC family protein [Edaphobacter flagellatus]|uniref:TolC family protein n=1 Tax=Edaphobacter flagellatus TaxID=1933044 RepID=UPI0021B42160|nr:TolC family protein [Edaphobacter flagellatus]
MIFRQLAIFSLLLAPCAFAQAGKQPLTLADALAMAQSNSPRLHEASAATDKATAAIGISRAYTNPSVEVFGGRQYARPIATPGVPGLLQHYAASQTLEVPSERRLRRSVAESMATSARYGQQAIALSVTADVKHAFYNALRREEEIRYAQDNLQLVDDLRHRVEVEVNVGEKGRLELTRAEAELARARFAVRSAQIEYANAIALLRAAIAAPPETNLDLTGHLAPRISLPPLQQVREQILRQHPAISQSQADLQASRTSFDYERALRIPQPTAFAEFENQPDLRYWRTGITIPIPLWDRRRSQIAQAQASIRQSDAVLHQRRLEIIAALERAYEQYQLADQQTTSLEAGSLHAAESAVDAAKAAYRFGERGIVEVLDAQRVLQSVRADLLDAQFARQAALIDLEELGAVAPGANP